MAKSKDITRISDLIPDANNYNKGTEFGRIGKKYCCLNCKTVFFSKKGCYSRMPMFCSKTCCVEHRRSIAKPNDAPKNQRRIAEFGTKECPICKKDFQYITSRAHTKTVCSIVCGLQYNANRLALITPEQRRRGIETRSDSQKWKDYIESRSGSNHPNYKGGKRPRREDWSLKSWRKSVFMRDFYTCQSCGVKAGKLEAHHIKPWATHPEFRYDVSNGITLCYECHNEVHGKEKREKTYHCKICGIHKTSGRRKMCRSCGAQNRLKGV